MLTENILTENIEDYASRVKIIKEIEISDDVQEIKEIDEEIQEIDEDYEDDESDYDEDNNSDFFWRNRLRERREDIIQSISSKIVLIRQIDSNIFTSLYRTCKCCTQDKPKSNFLRENFDICYLCKLRKDRAKLKYHCQHKKMKYRCRECKLMLNNGSSLCCHLAQKNNCKHCKDGEDSSIIVRRRERLDVCNEHNQKLCTLCIHENSQNN